MMLLLRDGCLERLGLKGSTVKAASGLFNCLFHDGLCLIQGPEKVE